MIEDLKFGKIHETNEQPNYVDAFWQNFLETLCNDGVLTEKEFNYKLSKFRRYVMLENLNNILIPLENVSIKN
jgi:hypothetical protein